VDHAPTATPVLNSSVAVGLGSPPKAKAAAVVPAPPNKVLPVDKSPVSAQLVPFQDSVKAPEGLVGAPPKAKAAVDNPVPAS